MVAACYMYFKIPAESFVTHADFPQRLIISSADMMSVG